MPTLPTELRKKLERVIIEARDIAETGAKEALETLAVHHEKPYDHMSMEQRRLRNHLRARARQLGDRQDRSGHLDIRHLIQECAYEHWHRMLFARFLAENDLLIHPEMGVAISLDECEELAKEMGTDLWSFAGKCAQEMLPQIFRPDDPLLQFSFAKERQLKLEQLLARLEKEVFIASDSLGWVYQFWQTKRKKEVNESGVKIGADELPAVTQLFTEDYMVDFMLDNTLGAWWAGKVSDEGFQVTGEEEARKACSLPGVEWKYLRFIKRDNDRWHPAAGTFDGWPRRAAELKCLDPCCGSGHFLVGLFERLVPIRMTEESLSNAEAARAVLRDNLYGLEIDPRCTQLAAFSLALAAWKVDPVSVNKPLPPMNIACCGLEIGGAKEDWIALAPENGFEMEQLYKLFINAPALGSLINPEEQASLDLSRLNFEKLQDTILLGLEKYRANRDFKHEELGVAARGLTESYRILNGKYHLVSTNVPYVASGKQDEKIITFIKRHYSAGKQNLATAFVERCLAFCNHSGSAAIVTPQNWLSLSSYKKLRQKILGGDQWVYVIKLGTKAFRTPMWDYNVMLTAFTHSKPSNDHEFLGIDVMSGKTPDAKEEQLHNCEMIFSNQKDQVENPDARITFGKQQSSTLLSKFAGSYVGLQNNDTPKNVAFYWEIRSIGECWDFFHLTSGTTSLFSGRSGIVRWPPQPEYLIKGQKAWEKRGVLIRQMGNLPATLFNGNRYDQCSAAIIPIDEQNLPALWCYCSSSEFNKEVRRMDQKPNVTNATLVKIPFDLEYWKKVAKKEYPKGLPVPSSSDPTQWIFKGLITDTTEPLQVAVARLMGYRWPEQEDDGLDDLADDDGIVCIPSVRGEEPAANRLRIVLAKAFGRDWDAGKERELIAATGSKARNLDEWFRNDFFEQHCKLFHHRPFIWQIWDGRKHDGFHALVDYHKLAEGDGKGRKVLEGLIYSYLNDWIARQKDGVKRGEGGAEDRRAAAVELKEHLIAIVEGEPPFDIFVRWKPLHEQPIGWEPDINDGVRLNIRPFMAPDMADGSRRGADLTNGRKGAGILRWKPNIKWNKDRGKEPKRPKDEYLWFWGWDETRKDFLGREEFDGNRFNACHYSNAVKRKAREKIDD